MPSPRALLPPRIGVGLLAQAPPPRFPLSIAGGGRYLQSPNGVPFLLIQDAAWSLGSYASDSDVDLYFATRAAQGFNAAIFESPERYYAGDPHGPNNPTGANFNGDTPFTGTTTGGNEDLSTPREAFWVRVDRILNSAIAHGIVPLYFPMYLGALNGGGGEGWYQQLCANSDAKIQAYADFLVARYGSLPLIWVIGGDLSGASTPTVSPAWATGLAKLLVFSDRLAAGLPSSAILTAHWAGEDQGSSTDYGNAAIHEINGVYKGPITHDECRAQYDASPTVPVFGIEHYYGEGTKTDAEVRSQSYQILCSGGCGTSYGNPGWIFGGATGPGAYGEFPGGGTWQSNLNLPSVLDVTRMRAAFVGRPWHRLVPNGKGSIGTLVTAGGGTEGTSNYVSAACTPEGDLLMAYVPDPHSGSVTIDMTKMAGTTRARWYDPRAGTHATDGASPLANTGTHAFTIPGANAGGDDDWLLVLESP